MNRRKKPELLVPAGSIEPFIAAVENGADAIYIGGRIFNARMNAGNFDDEIMPRVLDYAHARGVKVFVVMNTLVYDEEMDEAVNYARSLYRMGADALIIQDLGLGQRIHRELPDFPLHLSTQATSCDVKTVRTARKLGYERVVLSRELSLSEIEKICGESGTDIEVFVHGALCICYSGQCQMSRFYGGRSGNRGACAQPCRLPYEMTNVSGKRTSGHLLSPKDLCLIDDLGLLMEAGVTSFKIEGRMKSPEYVAVVTKIYRKYMDEYLLKGGYHVSSEDREALKQIFNRGGFTRGYLNGNPGRKLMSQVIPKNQGIRIGQVTAARNTSTLVDVRCDIEPKMGDGIEIRPDGKGIGPVASNIISYRKDLGDGVYRIGDFREPVRSGSNVYRTSSRVQLEEARQSFRNISVLEETENRRIGRRRDIVLMLSCFDGMLKLTAETVAESDNTWESQRKQQVTVSAGPFGVDSERATPEERYRGALSKTGSTPFRVHEIRLEGTFNIHVRASEINALRRACLRELEEKIRFRRELPPDKPKTDRADSVEWLPKEIERIPLASLCLEAEAEEIPLITLLERRGLQKVNEDAREDNKPRIPAISNVTRGKEDEILFRHLEEIKEAGKIYPILVGTLGWLARLAEIGCRVYADYGVNALNEESIRVLTSLGAEQIYPSLELLCREEIEKQRDLPLMVSEHDFGEGILRNSKRGICAEITRPDYSSQVRITPYSVTEVTE